MIDSSSGQCITAAIEALQRLAGVVSPRVVGVFNPLDADNLRGIAEALKTEIGRTPQQRTIIPLRSEVAWVTEDIAKMLESSSAQIIHARRGTGKTWNLLVHIFKRYGHEAIIVCPNEWHRETLQNTARMVYDLQYIRHVGDPAYPLPLVMTPYVFNSYIYGHPHTPTFVDEWNLFTLDEQVDIAKSGWLVKAVTS
jgi:hypothetical protein